MVRKMLLAVFSVIAFTGSAQEEFRGYQSILRTQGTFSIGYNMPFKSINYFLHGDLEYYFDEKFSVKSDIYYFLNSKTPSDACEPFAFQHSLFTGVNYHFLKGRLDVYAGLQPGIMTGQRQYIQIQTLDGFAPVDPPQKTVAMLFSIDGGLNYFASKYFHLFLAARYNNGWFSDNYSTASLSEIRFSFGLGFFLHTQKAEKSVTE